MKNGTRKLAQVLLILTFPLAASCGDDNDNGLPGVPGLSPPSGPINGSWALTTVSCDGATLDATEANLRMTITDATISTTLNETPTCTIALTASAQYPDAGVMQVANEAVSCNPSECSDICTEPLDRQNNMIRYEQTGDQLRLTETSTSADDLCTVGQQSVLTFRRAG